MYAVHRKSADERRVHVHFIVNAVNFKNGKKRRENKRETEERERRFGEVVEQELRSNKINPWKYPKNI